MSVTMWDGGTARIWSLWYPGYNRDYDFAFVGFPERIVDYPEELKQECITIPVGEEAEYLISMPWDSDFNCYLINGSHQGAVTRLRFEVCASTAYITFHADGVVERNGTHFDWFIARVYDLSDPGWTTIAYEHGTGESLECSMETRECCGFVTLPEGQYIIDIDTGTGDGLNHNGGGWDITMSVKCGEYVECGVGVDTCDADDPPWTPPGIDEPPGADGQDPEWDVPDPEAWPDYPGSRVPCECSDCAPYAMLFSFEPTEADRTAHWESASTTGGLPNEEEDVTIYYSKLRSFTLIRDTSEVWMDGLTHWRYDYGTPGSLSDRGLLVLEAQETRRADGYVPYTTTVQTYIYEVTAIVTCYACETLPGVAGISWHFTYPMTFSIQTVWTIPNIYIGDVLYSAAQTIFLDSTLSSGISAGAAVGNIIPVPASIDIGDITCRAASAGDCGGYADFGPTSSTNFYPIVDTVGFPFWVAESVDLTGEAHPLGSGC